MSAKFVRKNPQKFFRPQNLSAKIFLSAKFFKLIFYSKRSDGLYQAKVTEKDVLILRLLVENRAERAYLAKLYLEYDETELDEPSVVKRGEFNLNEHKVDIEKRELGKAVLALANPLEAGEKVFFNFLGELSAKFVRK